MAPTLATARSYPKRKRAEVSYCDGTSDTTEADEVDTEVERTPAKKKAKASGAEAKNTPLPKREIFPFASLPSELRNKIYFFALTDDQEIFLVSKTRQYRRTVQLADDNDLKKSRRRQRYGYALPSGAIDQPISQPFLVPNLLALNHQIRAEAQPILYGANVFALEDTTALHAFCANIGPKNCTALKELSIKGWGGTKAHKAMNHPAFTILASAVNLTRLHMDCLVHWGKPNQVARQFFREAHHWLEAFAVAKGQRGAAVEILNLGIQNFRPMYRYGECEEEKVQLITEQRVREFEGELNKLLKA